MDCKLAGGIMAKSSAPSSTTLHAELVSQAQTLNSASSISIISASGLVLWGYLAL